MANAGVRLNSSIFVQLIGAFSIIEVPARVAYRVQVELAVKLNMIERSINRIGRSCNR